MIENQKDLADLIGIENMFHDASKYNPEACLCNIDIDANDISKIIGEEYKSDGADYYFGEEIRIMNNG